MLSLRHASSDRWSRIPGPRQTGAEAEAGHLSAGTVLRKRHHRYPVCGRESAAQRGTQARWRTLCHNKRGNIGVEDKCGIAASESEYAAGNPLIRRRTAKSSAGCRREHSRFLHCVPGSWIFQSDRNQNPGADLCQRTGQVPCGENGGVSGCTPESTLHAPQAGHCQNK